MNPMRSISLFVLVLLISACQRMPAATGGLSAALSLSSANDPASFGRDHAAILAMAGEYKVDFAFDETVVLKPGYVRHPAHRSSGHEFIAVLEDSGTRVVLQHILVGEGGDVVKHWRQDWQYQQTRLWEYAGESVWKRRDVSPATVAGTWVQSVWQVDDSPRYAGFGRWTHVAGVSSWTSEAEWRPLPRREHTTRSDYDKLVGVNRQTVTPIGWVHEQDNVKIDTHAPDGQQALVREAGVDTYTRVTGYDFSAGHAYWDRTQDYWRNVRAAWAELFAHDERVELRKTVDDRLLYEAMFEQADELGGRGESAGQLRDAIDRTLHAYIAPPAIASASRQAGAR